mgnify:FL=1
MKKRFGKRAWSVLLTLAMICSMLLGTTAYATDDEPTQEYAESQTVSFDETTYTVQLGSFGVWQNALNRWKLAKAQGWDPYFKYEKIGNRWYYKVWTLHTTDYSEAKSEFERLKATDEGAKLFEEGQLRIYEYLCPYVEVIYESYNGEKKVFDVEVRGNSYEEDDVGLYNPTTLINSVSISTNSGSKYVDEFFRYDVEFASSKPNYQFELINAEKYEQKQEPTVTQTATGLNEKWTFYLTDNTTATTSLEGAKVWDDQENANGRRPESITVNLLANGTKVDSKEVTADDGWAFKFKDLPKYIAGTEAVYTVSEEPVEYYTTSIAGNTITNTYDESQETINITVTKIWEDEGNESKRPSSITVRLLADGSEVAHKDVTSADDWKCTFENLDKYNGEEEINYTVGEDKVTDYTTTVDGYTITNKYKEPTPPPTPDPEPEVISITVTKVWKDEGNESKRPSSITVRLFADETEVAHKDVTSADDWKCTFENLDKYNGEKEINYTVGEDKVTDYTTTVDGYTITNKYKEPTPPPTPDPEPEVISITVTKVWKDKGYEEKRPSSITVRLFADGTEVAHKKVTEADDWKCTFENLDKYDGGKEIKYTVDEDKVNHYTTTVDGYTITNKYKKSTPPPTPDPDPETVNITVTKTWQDKDYESKRPSSITIRLLADGTEVAHKYVTSEDNWKCTFKGQPKYNSKGKKISYTISEDKVEDYTTYVDGYNVINKYEKPEDSKKIEIPEEPKKPEKGNELPIVEDPEKVIRVEEPAKETGEKINTPKTGDNSAISGGIATICAIATGMMLLILRRKKEI